MAPSLTTTAPSYALVEINRNSLLALARRAPPTLRGYFGDYRPAGSPNDRHRQFGSNHGLGSRFGRVVLGARRNRMSPGSRSAAIPDQVVGRDGSVTVPYAGRIQVAGRNQHEVEAAIVERLRGKAIEPQAVVNVTRNITNTVTVTGEVANGARVPLSLNGDRVMDVIAAAGGYRSPVHETFVTLDPRRPHGARAHSGAARQSSRRHLSAGGGHFDHRAHAADLYGHRRDRRERRHAL